MRRTKPEAGPTPPAKKPRKQEGEPSLSRLTARQLTVARLVSSYKYECKKVFQQLEESQRQWSMEIDSKKQSHCVSQDPSRPLESPSDRLRFPEPRPTQLSVGSTDLGEPWKQSERDVLKRCFLTYGLSRWREIENSVRRLQRTNRHSLHEMESSCWELVSKLESCLEGKEKDYLKLKLLRVSDQMPFQSCGAPWTKYQTSARSWARRLQLLDNIRLLRNQMRYPSLKQFFKDSLGLMSDANPPTSWWCPDADLLLITGAYTYGYGNYEELRSDAEFFQLFKQSCMELGHTPRALDQQGGSGGLTMITEWPATDLLTKRLKRITDNLIKAQQRTKNKIMMVEISFEKLAWTVEQKNELITTLMKFGLPTTLDSTSQSVQEQWKKLFQSPYLESLTIIQGQALCNELLSEMESIVNQRSDDRSIEEDMEEALKSNNFKSTRSMVLDIPAGIEAQDTEVFTLESAVQLRGQLHFLKLLKTELQLLKDTAFVNKLKSQADRLPEWWVCGVHDHEMLIGIKSQGLGSWNEILNNQDYSFWKCRTVFQKTGRSIKDYCPSLDSFPTEAVDRLITELDLDLSKEQENSLEDEEGWIKQRVNTIGVLLRDHGVVQDYLSTNRTGLPRAVQEWRPPPASHRDSVDSVVYPVVVSPLLSVLFLGTIEFERGAFHSGKHIFPIGYRSQRRIETRSFICEVIDGGTTPVFQVTAENDSNLCIKHESLTEVWKMLLSQVPEAKKVSSGEDLFGFSYLSVMNLIKTLPNAQKCLQTAESPSQSIQRPDLGPQTPTGVSRNPPSEALPDWLSRLSSAVSLTAHPPTRPPHTSMPYHGVINRTPSRASSQHRGVLLLNPSQGMQSLTNVQQSWRPGGYSWMVRPVVGTNAVNSAVPTQPPTTIPLSAVHAGLIRPHQTRQTSTSSQPTMLLGRNAGNSEGQKHSAVFGVNTGNEGQMTVESIVSSSQSVPMSSVNYPTSLPTTSPPSGKPHG